MGMSGDFELAVSILNCAPLDDCKNTVTTGDKNWHFGAEMLTFEVTPGSF